MTSLGTLQTFLKENAGPLMDFKQHRAQFRFFGLCRTGKADLGHSDAKFLRDRPDRLGKSNILDFLDKAENIAR